jgi:hypothetical protein
MALTKTRNRMIAGSSPSVIDFGAVGDGTTNDRAAFLAAEGAGSAIYVPAGTYRITASMTLTKVVIFSPGAVLYPSAGVTITLSGEISAGFWQIFNISLGGTIAGPVRNQYVYPDWWGGNPKNNVNQSPVIQAAIYFAQAGARTVYLRNGLWRCDETLYMKEPAGIVGDPGIPAQGVTADNTTLDFSNALASSHGLVVGRDIDFPLDGIALHNFAIFRANQVATGSGCCGLLLRSVMQAEVHNVQSWRWDKDFSIGGSASFPSAQCEFRACRGQYAGTNHWEVWAAIDISFDRCFGGGGPAEYCCYVFSNTGSGQPNALHWTNCIFVSPDAKNGIRILSGFYHLIENTVFEEMNEAGILVSLTAVDPSIVNVWVAECGFNNCGDGFGSVGGQGNFRIRDCRIESSTGASNYPIIIDSTLTSAVERDIIIEGNNLKVTGASATGIYMNHVRGAIIRDNRIICAGTGSANAGVTLSTDTSSIQVSGNRTLTSFVSADGLSNNGTNNTLSGNTKM